MELECLICSRVGIRKLLGMISLDRRTSPRIYNLSYPCMISYSVPLATDKFNSLLLLKAT
jgi:hypothetical protein